MPLFEVDDSAELWALWRLIVEAKFHPNPEDGDLWASPLVHSLAKRIDDALFFSYQSKDDAQFVETHLRWRKSLPENALLAVVKMKLRQSASTDWWRKLAPEERLLFVRGCVAPFEPSADFLESLVREAEA